MARAPDTASGCCCTAWATTCSHRFNRAPTTRAIWCRKRDAADTNNLDHAHWVDQIRCRNRVYITINEDDSALRVSRMKAGDQQRARLGHYTYGLDSSQGVYVNFTKTKHVGDSHAYFEGDPVEKNPRVKAFFQAAVNGETAETPLPYNAAKNLYGIE